MGDGITSWFDTLVFLAIFVGVPALIFGLPVAVLIFLAARRQQRLAANDPHTRTERSPLFAWLLAFFALLGITAFVFTMTAVGFAP